MIRFGLGLRAVGILRRIARALEGIEREMREARTAGDPRPSRRSEFGKATKETWEASWQRRQNRRLGLRTDEE
jgi:hypothetical protein